MNNDVLQLLTERGSLTRRMQELLGYAPRLRCAFQRFGRPYADEALALGIEGRRFALIREIYMGSQHADWLFARTIVPQSTLQGPGQRLRLLRNQPLGVKLFGRMGAQRKELTLDFAALENQQLAKRLGLENKKLWQRRSVFEIGQSPILIEEIFLPGCPVYQTNT